MSSRRKSRPIRRLDMICSKLQETCATSPTEGWAQYSDHDGGGVSPEVQDDGTRTSSTPTSEYANDQQNDNLIDSENISNENAGMLASNPPEGVYILQPESVSDDEEMKNMKPRNNAKTPKSCEARKRSHKDDEMRGEFDERNRTSPGLDLSVKRPRIDGTSNDLEDFEKMNNGLPQSTSPDLFNEHAQNDDVTSTDEQLEKYHRLMRLVEQQIPLTQAMEEVGLSVHEFFALHRLNNQMLTSARLEKPLAENEKVMSAPSTVPSMFDKFSIKDQQLQNTQIDHDWSNGKAKHDAKIQALLKETSEDVLQQQKQHTEAQQLGDNRLQLQPTTLNPSMAAALMATLSSSQHHSAEERKDALRNLFMKGIYGTNDTPNKGMDSFNSTGNSPSVLEVSKNDSITAGTVSSGVGSIKKGTLDPSNFDEDVFDQYIAKFTNMNRCGLLTCQYYTRDHYHCVVDDCNYMRFTNKADVIRHYNMHKKRDNSLAHGFLRFSPTEDCSAKYPNCHLNGKSTHYHCMQPDCNKVYTSTSDVMTHENFHKKYMQFVCSGFKRFRATEQCDLESCAFRNQKTTHFHCTRGDCEFTFKNKCDIEKHKTYHMRDDQYISKGFKKFYKNEACSNSDCVWNYTANHFHCLRPGCNFSFTSTSQMDSHKRKHDRNEFLGEDNNTSINSNQNSPKVPMFSPAMFQEAARKLLSTIPSVSLPQIMGGASSHSMPLGDSSNYGTANASSHGPLSPSTPSSARSFHDYNSTQKIKEEPSWMFAANYENSMPTALNMMKPNEVTVSASQSPTSATDNTQSVSARGSGVISPSMAISAAAALKPAVSNIDSVPTLIRVESIKHDVDVKKEFINAGENFQNMKSELDEKNSGSAFDSKMIIASKYFVGANAYKCWIVDCDFFTKRHFHCLVENCEAMFISEESVLKHAKFHENLESMGATIPIQSISNAVATKNTASHDPPPGYIALESRVMKLATIASERDATPTAENLSLVEQKPKIEPSSDIAHPSSLSLFTPNRLLQSQGNYTSLASQIYANALMKNRISTDAGNRQPLSSTPLPAYRLMDNSATLSALMARMTQAAPSQSDPEGNTNASSDLQRSLFNSKKAASGYVHIKAGTPCMRLDCKYANQNHWHCTMNRCRYVCKSLGKAQTHREAHDSLDAYAKSAKECFRSYSVKKQCPNVNCEFRLRGHYHCLKPGCTFVTIGTSKLPWHMKKHEKIARREASGFKYYTKKEHCNYYNCKYDGLFSHYHCVRSGCTFAFQYKHQMSTHVRKHLRRMLGRTYNGTGNEEVKDIDHTNVDSGDDSLPLIIDEVEEAEQRPGVGNEHTEKEQLSNHQKEVLERMTQQYKSSYEAVTAAQQDLASEDLNKEELERFTALENDDSNSDDETIEHYGALDLSSLAAGSSNSNDSVSQRQPPDVESMNEDSMSNGHGNVTDEGNMEVENGNRTSADQSPMTKTSPDQGFAKFKLGDGVLEGFQRFEVAENCGDEKCAYGFKVAHFHCTRETCDYRFTGRSHMFKHQQHHDRVAGLVRDDFKRFKATQLCEDEQCEFRGKNTHFHCLRCDFKCTDSAKVGTHRRQHMKADALEQSGFQRVRGKDDCGREECKYRFRNMSHFHCLQPGCSYAIVGLTGIELHAEKHKRGLLQRVSNNVPESTSLVMRNLSAYQDARQQLLNASLAQNGLEDGSSNTFSIQTLAALRNMQNQIAAGNQQFAPTSPPDRSDSSPFMLAQNGSGHLLTKFALLGSGVVPKAPSSTTSSPPYPPADQSENWQHNASAPSLPTTSSPTHTQANQGENDPSDMSSPFIVPVQGEQGQLLSKFAFLGSTAAPQRSISASSPPIRSQDDQNENSHSNVSSPFMMSGQNEPGQLMSKFSFLSSAASQGHLAATSSPVASPSINMVTEGVGS